MTRPPKRRDTHEPDAVRIYGAALAIAWQKYHQIFGDVPHGTLDQMAALVEFAGGKKALINVGNYATAAAKAKRGRGK